MAMACKGLKLKDASHLYVLNIVVYKKGKKSYFQSYTETSIKGDVKIPFL